MKLFTLFALLLVFVLCLTGSRVSAQDVDESDLHMEEEGDTIPEEEDDIYEAEPDVRERVPSNRVHPLTDIPEPFPHITYHVLFPDQDKANLPLGHPITVLVGLVNSDSQPVNISFAMGSLNSDQMFSNYIQNFTKRDLNSTLPGFSEITLSYRFATYYDLEPSSYQLALTVFYETESDEYATTFFNETVSFYEKRTGFDFKILYSLMVVTAMVGALVFIFCGGKSSNSSSKKHNSSKPREDDSDEWLADTLVGNEKSKQKSE